MKRVMKLNMENRGRSNKIKNDDEIEFALE